MAGGSSAPEVWRLHTALIFHSQASALFAANLLSNMLHGQQLTRGSVQPPLRSLYHPQAPAAAVRCSARTRQRRHVVVAAHPHGDAAHQQQQEQQCSTPASSSHLGQVVAPQQHQHQLPPPIWASHVSRRM